MKSKSDRQGLLDYSAPLGKPDERKNNAYYGRWKVRTAAVLQKHPSIPGNIAINSTSKICNARTSVSSAICAIHK